MDRPEAEVRLAALWRRGTDFLGSRVAILGGAMSWVSERHLVSAISNAGGFGVIACGSMTPALLEAEIAASAALAEAERAQAQAQHGREAREFENDRDLESAK